MKKNNSSSLQKEVNVQNIDLWKTYSSNSQFHYKDISNFNFEHRIRLNPLGESKSMDVRNQFPLNHVRDSFQKNDYLSERNCINKKTAYDKANIQSKINSHSKAQNYQILLAKDKHIEKLCNIKNKEIKSELDNRKNKLKQQLIRIINDALLFSRKNNPIKSMLPDNINEIIDKVKKKTQENMSFSMNLSNLSRISTLKNNKKHKSNEILSLLGVDMDNLTLNHVNLDINKAWNFVLKLAKGRKIEDILRLKVVNEIMSLNEKKSSEKVKLIYKQLELYKNYMKKKELKEKRKKEKEEKLKYQDLLKNNPNELIRLKMVKSLSEPKLFDKDINIKKKKDKNIKKISKKKLKKSKSANIFQTEQKRVTKLNAYNDINQIVDFIESSKKESQSKLYKEHFMNIKATKSIDFNLKNMLKKNEIKIS